MNFLSERFKRTKRTHEKHELFRRKPYSFSWLHQCILFDSKLETKGGKPSLKQKSVAKPLELKEEYNLCDIWRIKK